MPKKASRQIHDYTSFVLAHWMNAFTLSVKDAAIPQGTEVCRSEETGYIL